MLYSIFNKGPNPQVVRTTDGRYTHIALGQIAEVEISLELARILARRDGALQLRLSEKQAEQINMPDDTGYAIQIPKDWEEISWLDRKKLASKLNNNHNVTNGRQANSIIEKELMRRKEIEG